MAKQELDAPDTPPTPGPVGPEDNGYDPEEGVNSVRDEIEDANKGRVFDEGDSYLASRDGGSSEAVPALEPRIPDEVINKMFELGDLDIALVDSTLHIRREAALNREAMLRNYVNEAKGIRKFGRMIWANGIMRFKFLKKYEAKIIDQAKAENYVYAFDGDDDVQRLRVRQAMVHRFTDRLGDELVRTEAGEKRKELDKNSAFATASKDLVSRFVLGEIDEGSFDELTDKLIRGEYGKGLGGELHGSGEVYTANLKEVANKLRGALAHADGVERIRLMGEWRDKSRVVSGLEVGAGRTEVVRTKHDKLLEKFQSGPFGSLVSTETAVAAIQAAAILSNVAVGKLSTAFWWTGIPVLIYGVRGGARQAERSRGERALDLDNAEMGRSVEDIDNSKLKPAQRWLLKRSGRFEKARFEMDSVQGITQKLDALIDEDGKLKEGTSVPEALELVGNIRAKLLVADQDREATVAYGGARHRSERDVALAELTDKLSRIKIELKRAILADAEIAAMIGVTTATNMNDLLQKNVNERSDIIRQQHEASNKTAKKIIHTDTFVSGMTSAGVSLASALVLQDAMAFMDDSRQGAIETAIGIEPNVGPGEEVHNTITESLINGPDQEINIGPGALQQDPNMPTVLISSDSHIQPNGNGTIDILDRNNNPLASGVKINPDNSFPQESIDQLSNNPNVRFEDLSHVKPGSAETVERTIGVGDFLNNQAEVGNVIDVKGINYLGNNTEFSDLNELRFDFTKDAEGNIYGSVGRMSSDGSFNELGSSDIEKLVGEGRASIFLSLDRSNPNTMLEFPISPETGDYVWSADSDLVKSGFWSDTTQPNILGENGVDFHGGYARPGFVDQEGTLTSFATAVGDGEVKEVTTVVPNDSPAMEYAYEISSKEGVVEVPTVTDAAPVIPIEVYRSSKNFHKSGVGQGDKSRGLARESGRNESLDTKPTTDRLSEPGGNTPKPYSEVLEEFKQTAKWKNASKDDQNALEQELHANWLSRSQKTNTTTTTNSDHVSSTTTAAGSNQSKTPSAQQSAQVNSDSNRVESPLESNLLGKLKASDFWKNASDEEKSIIERGLLNPTPVDSTLVDKDSSDQPTEIIPRVIGPHIGDTLIMPPVDSRGVEGKVGNDDRRDVLYGSLRKSFSDVFELEQKIKMLKESNPLDINKQNELKELKNKLEELKKERDVATEAFEKYNFSINQPKAA